MQASDGMFHSNCSVNITVLDVNNNAPVFSEDSYSAVVMEDTPVGKYLTQNCESDFCYEETFSFFPNALQ